MKLKHLWKAAGLVALSAILILTLCLAGLLALVLRSAQITQFWNAPLTKLSQSLVLEEGRYHFTGEDLLAQQDLWLMLVGRDGQVLWQYNKPAEVPDQYDLLDVAAFTRWYLEDYPVQTRIRPDGLLVAGAPKGSTWKLTISLSEQILHLLPVWGVLLFFLSLICVLALAALLLRRWFRQDQQARDEARSDWINGISHDIRTPLSMVMGYAGQLEADSALPPARRDQAAIIRRQSQTIRDLVNDLNLTMRLDCQMQALRKTKLDLAPFLRQTWKPTSFSFAGPSTTCSSTASGTTPRGLSSAWGPGRQARHACSGWKTPPPMPLPHHCTRRRTVAQPTEPG